MMYHTLVINGEEYKLRLNTRDIVALEKKLGCNPMGIFTGVGGAKIPTVTDMTMVFHASLQQYHHGKKLEDAQDLYDAWINEEGHSMTDFVNEIMELYRVSGIIPTEANEKN